MGRFPGPAPVWIIFGNLAASLCISYPIPVSHPLTGEGSCCPGEKSQRLCQGDWRPHPNMVGWNKSPGPSVWTRKPGVLAGWTFRETSASFPALKEVPP